MSTKTENYQLHQWAAEDQFLRTDFNEDHAKIDAAIKAAYERAGTVESSLTNAINQKASASALTALQGTVNGKASTSALNSLQTVVANKIEIVSGSYAGTASYPREVNLGFKPKLVFIQAPNGQTVSGSGNSYGGFFTEAMPLTNSGTVCAAITDRGFKLLGSYTNLQSNTYYYFCVK